MRYLCRYKPLPARMGQQWGPGPRGQGSFPKGVTLGSWELPLRGDRREQCRWREHSGSRSGKHVALDELLWAPQICPFSGAGGVSETCVLAGDKCRRGPGSGNQGGAEGAFA